MHPDLEFIKGVRYQTADTHQVSLDYDDFDWLMYIAEVSPHCRQDRSGERVYLDLYLFHELIHRATQLTHERIAAQVAAKLKAAL